MNQNALSYMCFFTLAGCLATACWRDLISRRIPNWLVVGGALLGLFLQITVEHGAGLFSMAQGGLGGQAAFTGCAVGILVLLPMYVMHALGAGDVKLMGMVGVFLGPAATLDAVVMTLLIGGILSVVIAARFGVLQAAISNVRMVITQSVVRVMSSQRPVVAITPASAVSLPYAFAIAAGTLSEIVLSRAGHVLFA